jgi:iron complex transport system substrate-binding protein
LADKLVATDIYSKDIKGVDQNLSNIDFFYPDAEAIIMLEPDLIIANGLNSHGAASDPFAMLTDIPVVYIPMSDSIDGIYKDIAFIAEILNAKKEGEKIIADMKDEVDYIKNIGSRITNRKTVYFEVSPSPSIVCLGSGTYLNEMIEITGARNIFADKKGIVYPSVENILERNPDVIMTNIVYIDDAIGEIKSRPGFEFTTAVKDNAVYLVDANSSSRPSNHIVYALKQMAKDIYPEYYDEQEQ